MASRIDPAIKKRLEDDGTWVSMHVMRRRLIQKGEDADEAEAIALKKFLIPMETDGLRVTPPGSNRKDGMTTEQVKEQGAAFRKQTREEARVPRKVFEGKECTYREEVEWVASNIEVRGVKASDAPSAAAWMLLKFARSSPTNLMYFCKDFYAKLNTLQATADEEGPFKDDGQEIIDTIETLRAAGK